MRIKLTIAYDGAPYKGWQYQPGMVTVQETIEEALSAVAKQRLSIYASGRTDTGVHANGQVAHFDAPASLTLPPARWAAALNTKLPPFIRIIMSEQVAEDFHSRFSAVSKTYQYRVITREVMHPHYHGRAWHMPRGLDLAILQQVMEAYQGEHDFRHFSALRGNETEETSYVRHITEACYDQQEDGVVIRYSGNGFLYKMVRILTGVAVQAAQGRMELSQLHAMLSDVEGEYNTAKFCAPAGGLTLQEVRYPTE